MLITLYKIVGVHFRLLATNGFHVNAKNERFTVASLRCRQNLKYENFTSSFGRLRQNIASKSVPHVQHDYFSSFNQSNHWFVALSLTLSSSNVKLPFVWTTWAYDNKCPILSSFVPSAGSNLIPGQLEHIFQPQWLWITEKWLQKLEVTFSDDVLAFRRRHVCLSSLICFEDVWRREHLTKKKGCGFVLFDFQTARTSLIKK